MSEGGDPAFGPQIIPQKVTALILKEDRPLPSSNPKEKKPENRRFIIKTFEGGKDACIPFDMAKDWSNPAGNSHDHRFVDLHQTTAATVADKLIGGDENLKPGAKVLVSFGEAGNIGSPVITNIIDAKPKFAQGFGSPSSQAAVQGIATYGWKFRKGKTGVIRPFLSEDACKKPVYYGTREYSNRLFIAAKMLVEAGYRAEHCWNWVRAVHAYACMSIGYSGRGGNYRLGFLWAGGQYDRAKPKGGTNTIAQATGKRSLWDRARHTNPKKRLWLPNSEFGIIKPGAHLCVFNNHATDIVNGSWHGGHSVLFEKWVTTPEAGLAYVYSQGSTYYGGKYHIIDLSVCNRIKPLNDPKNNPNGDGGKKIVKSGKNKTKCRGPKSKNGMRIWYGPVVVVLKSVPKGRFVREYNKSKKK